MRKSKTTGASSPADNADNIPPPIRELHTALDHGDSERIAETVRLAELATNSEILVKLSAATGEGSVRDIAQAEFIRLGVAALPGENGVLIYVSLNRHAVEVVVGPQAAAKISQEIWEQCAAHVADGFRSNAPADGIIRAVETMAPALAATFPPTSAPGPELPNICQDS